jgi:hypothetical protein
LKVTLITGEISIALELLRVTTFGSFTHETSTLADRMKSWVSRYLMSIDAIAMEDITMALGHSKSVQQRDLFITAVNLLHRDGHVFDTRLHLLLEEAGFDNWIEKHCAPYYS